MNNQKKTIDYKWIIVGLCFIMVFTALGFISSTKSLFVAPVTEALGIKRSAFSLGDSCRFIATAVVNIFFGYLVSRFGTKKLIAAGFLSLILSLVIYATTTKVYMFCIGGALLGIGFSWTTTTMVGCVITRWCKENRGTIMGAVLAANGLGGALAMQIFTPIIYDGAFGYRKAYLLMALILLIVGVLVVAFFREKPKDYSAEYASSVKKKSRGQSWEGIEYSSAIRKAYFYVAAVCVFFTGMVLMAVNGVAAAHMKDSGLDADYIATVLTINSLALAAFKFLTGFLYDKRGLRFTITACCVSAVCVMFLLTMMNNSMLGMIIAMIYAIFSALALPLETIMLPIYAGDLFGEKSFDKILGIFVSLNTAGYALGTPAINLCYDVFGSYNAGFFAGGIIMLFVTICMQLVISVAQKQKEISRKDQEEREYA